MNYIYIYVNNFLVICVQPDDNYVEVAETCSCDVQNYVVYLTVSILYIFNSAGMPCLKFKSFKITPILHLKYKLKKWDTEY